MTAYARPAWMVPAAFSAQLVPQVRSFASPYGGAGQALDLLGEKWQFTLELPPMFKAAAAAREAFLHRLMGGAHTVGLHHFGRPYPLGTARGTITLASSAAAGAASIAIGGARSGPNLISGGGFEIDTNADGIADGWSSYTTGTTGTLTYTQAAGALGTDQGVFYQVATASALNGRVGVVRSSAQAVTAGLPYAFSLEQTASGGTTRHVAINWLDSGGGFLGEATANSAANGRLACAGVAPAGTATALLYAWAESTAGTGMLVNFDHAQFEQAPAATAYAGLPTLRAGDVLGLGGQLLMVAEDVTLSDAGAGTVQLVNRVRAARSGGAAVTWERPTAEFALMDAPGVPAAYVHGATVPGLALTFQERWA